MENFSRLDFGDSDDVYDICAIMELARAHTLKFQSQDWRRDRQRERKNLHKKLKDRDEILLEWITHKIYIEHMRRDWREETYYS